LQAERETAGRNVLATEHANQIVVASAATETASSALDGDFHDGAGVIGETAGQSRCETDTAPGGCRLSQGHDRGKGAARGTAQRRSPDKVLQCPRICKRR